jgi:quinol-cytochrome oxidoreductase complex cytochrome b subunit
MPSDFSRNDPQKIWQSQPTEQFKMSPAELRHRAIARQSRARLEARFTGIVGLVCTICFAWSFTRAHSVLAQVGWALLTLWGLYAAYYAYKWIRPAADLPEDAPVQTCLEFYRRELERRRDNLRRRWWSKRLGWPVVLLGAVMAMVGTGAPQVGGAVPAHPLLKALPFFVILAIWAVVFVVMKKKLRGENLEEEIAELRDFQRDHWS